MSSSEKTAPGLKTAALVVIATLVGVALAQLLPPDLFGLRSNEQSVVVEEGLYTCGMHPEVLLEEPGQCPICGMDLVPVEGATTQMADHQHESEWTCPEHPSIVESEPGTCPIDGLDLVPVEHAEPHGSSGMAISETGASSTGEREVLFYLNPMDPTITSPVPAKDSMGMDYTPVYADKAGSGNGSARRIRIDPVVVQNMNVRTEPVVRHDLQQTIRTVGFLEYDQQRMVTVTTKYTGFIEKVYVNYIGENVRRGQPLFEIYSPELVQTEQDLLSALDFARQLEQTPGDAQQRAEALVNSARERLRYWDISQEQIEKLEETGKVFRTLVVTSPSTGLVMKRMPSLEGMAAQPGMELFHIANLASLWVSVELFEDQVAWVREGTKADIELSYFPGESFSGAVRYLEPELSDRTRTIRAKIEIQNRDGRLRTGMYATVEFKPVLVANALAIPSEAVIRTGTRNIVVVALGEGHFEPHEVELGLEVQGEVQILSGLEEGALVVTSAQFLLDSESKLREAIQKMIASRS